MNGCIEQWYVNVLAVWNVCEKVLPCDRLPLSKLPSSAVAVCADGPLFVQVTVPPTAIVTVAGVNSKSLIATDADLAPVPGVDAGDVVAAAEVLVAWGAFVVVAAGAFVAVAAGAAVLPGVGVLLLLELPQAMAERLPARRVRKSTVKMIRTFEDIGMVSFPSPGHGPTPPASARGYVV
jgi:hypothetical protein